MADSPSPDHQLVCRLTGVGKRHRFRGPWALLNVDLVLRASTIVEVSGADGAGKSTLLNLIAGSADPTTGTVTRTYEGAEFRAHHVPSGLMLSGLSYLRNLAGEGRTRDEANARIDALSTGLALEQVLRLPVSQIPADAGHRLSLCRALANPSQLIVLDDPWSGLDEHARRFLVQELVERRAAGACIVVTDEHSPPDALPVDERYTVDAGGLKPAESAPEPS